MVVQENFERLLNGRSEQASLKEATIIFYGLSTYPEMITSIEKFWQDMGGNRRLVYYRNCLFPEIMPDECDQPFFLSRYPFHKTTDKLKWLIKVVGKDNSSIGRKEIQEDELWDELRHDYRVEGDWRDVEDYQKRLSNTPRCT